MNIISSPTILFRSENEEVAESVMACIDMNIIPSATILCRNENDEVAECVKCFCECVSHLSVWP